MLSYNAFLDILIILFIYMFIYNLSLLIFFWTLQQFININIKTLFSLNDFKYNYYCLTLISIILFSMAGVPPFIGFFSKLLILITLLNSNFLFFYIFFFSLLFFGLYFYMQNIRFLYSSSFSTLQYIHLNNLRISTIYIYFTHIFLFFIIFGFIFFDDLFLYFTWLFY